MATTLERYSFAKPINSYVRLKVVDPTGIAVGNSLTVTKPDGTTLTGTVNQLLPLGQLVLKVTASSKPSGMLLLPKGSAIA
jgi:hypothetical protein